ncbi:hypothetical protein [Pseudomonas duriflava]|uniref:hypothetical protein n=1 Tax=Pseudomonas duriflava TaxID=459528 RepID=UPI0011A258C8|nr:hypothetical protein [Pseudomonas duriflava]
MALPHRLPGCSGGPWYGGYALVMRDERFVTLWAMVLSYGHRCHPSFITALPVVAEELSARTSASAARLPFDVTQAQGF